MDKTPAELESDLYRLCGAANKAEREWVQHEETYATLNDNKKELFASICEQMNFSTTAEKERMALQDKSWLEFKKGLQEARRLASEAEVAKNAAIRNWDTCRSLLTSKNTERRTLT